MGRGVGYGGGQSSLGYLFGGGDTQPSLPPQKPSDGIIITKPSQNPVEPSDSNNNTETAAKLSEKSSSESSYNVINQNPKAAAHDSMTNNYHRVDGQNCGNYITVPYLYLSIYFYF